MWLRHALNAICILTLFSCTQEKHTAVDNLNGLSYAYHYRNIDSTEYYARQALAQAVNYADGHAEALNNLAFVCTIRMQYDEAQRLLDSVPLLTDNQVELLVASVQQMRICQRRSLNREFYDHREQAMRALRRIDEDRSLLTPRQRQRLVYAESELAIVTSTYYYYIGLERQSVQAIDDITPDVEDDTAQFLAYLYNVGAGGIIIQGTQEEINQQEFEMLVRCYQLAGQAGYSYFEANALEALAEHLMTPDYSERLLADNPSAIKLINPDDIYPDELPLWLAGRALVLFQEYGDTYQTAGAYRTLASCYVLGQGDFESALYNLEMALADTTIQQAPDLVASIHEQMSVAFAAIDNHEESQRHRDIYLELQEQTRQDRELEAQAALLDTSVARLHTWLAVVLAATVVLAGLLLLFYLRHRHYRRRQHVDDDLLAHEEEVTEQLALARLHVADGERLALEQRAKVSMVNSITPFIDRMIHAIGRLDGCTESEQVEYVQELIDKINEQNDVLTHWIQLRQGQLNLHIGTFRLQELFDIVGKGKMSFHMKGIDLDVTPTDASVKADKVLTLFMLNTLADNARKFTPEGGHVGIAATEGTDYVEISVSDTGIGMDAEQLAHVFDRKTIADDKAQSLGQKTQSSHGFGLLNCKGIIEKYRKVSSIFNVCLLSAESTPGHGSRFFFRLPKGVARIGLLLAMVCGGNSTYGDVLPSFGGAGGGYTYESYDSVLQELNRYYLSVRPESPDTLTLMGDASAFPNDVLWYDDSLQIDFNALLTLRNDLCLTALQLHDWPLYRYNNRIYTLLYREMSADKSLADHCRRQQQAQSNSQVAIVLFVLLLLSILVAAVWLVVLSMNRSVRRRQEQLSRLELLEDDLHRTQQEEARLHVNNAILDNTLSTLKHETMYYPSRIRQLLTIGDETSLSEVTKYYRELYGILSEQSLDMTSQRLTVKSVSLDDVVADVTDKTAETPSNTGDALQILGNENLLRYLFDILAKQAGTKALTITSQPKDDEYVDVSVQWPGTGTEGDLFAPAIQNIPFLLCKQIVREHGEATGRRGCGIHAVQGDTTMTIVVTLPRDRKDKQQTMKYGKL